MFFYVAPYETATLAIWHRESREATVGFDVETLPPASLQYVITYGLILVSGAQTRPAFHGGGEGTPEPTSSIARNKLGMVHCKIE